MIALIDGLRAARVAILLRVSDDFASIFASQVNRLDLRGRRILWSIRRQESLDDLPLSQFFRRHAQFGQPDPPPFLTVQLPPPKVLGNVRPSSRASQLNSPHHS